MSLPAQLQAFSLYGAGATLGDQDITLTTFTGIDGEALNMSYFGSKGFGTLEPGSGTQEEQISFTGITNNANGTTTLNGVKTVLFLSPFTETAGLAKSHAGGVRFVISNTSGFYSKIMQTDGGQTVTVPIIFDSTTGRPVLSTDVDASLPEQLVSAGQLTRTAISGGVNASTTVAGISKLTTAPTSPTDPIAIGATDATTTPTANRIPRSNGSNKIAQGWLDLAATWVFTGAVDITASLWKLGGVAYTGTMALLNEAATFFTATDMTGAEAETLSSGETSNADTLHTHKLSSLLRNTTFSNIWLDEDIGFTDTGVAVSMEAAGAVLTSSGSTGGARRLVPATSTFNGGFNKALTMNVWVMLDSVAALDAFIGFGAETDAGNIQENNVLTKRHIAFMVQDSGLYCSVADGTSQTLSASMATLVANSWNLLTIVYTPGTSCNFYLNGTLLTNLNTFLPTGTTDYNFFRIGIEGDSASKNIYYRNGALLSIAP